MHFGDYTFIFLLALILFGPKRMPEIGRRVGRLMMEFRRASNEFKMQIEEELRNLEEEDRQKKLNEAAASTGNISQPNALPSEITQAETLTNAEADSAEPQQPYTPPHPYEECIDPVDLLDAPQTHAEDLYSEDSRAGKEDYSTYREYEEAEGHGPEITAETPDSSDSYLPSDEPSVPMQAEAAMHETSMNPQDPVRPESDQAIRHA